MDGVKFKEYDELGLPKGDGFDYYKYITTDTNTLDTVIEASPDQMLLAMNPTGLRIDMDVEERDMNAEGKWIVQWKYQSLTKLFLCCRVGRICCTFSQRGRIWGARGRFLDDCKRGLVGHGVGRRRCWRGKQKCCRNQERIRHPQEARLTLWHEWRGFQNTWYINPVWR